VDGGTTNKKDTNRFLELQMKKKNGKKKLIGAYNLDNAALEN
jgi:hypothetical protein